MFLGYGIAVQQIEKQRRIDDSQTAPATNPLDSGSGGSQIPRRRPSIPFLQAHVRLNNHLEVVARKQKAVHEAGYYINRGEGQHIDVDYLMSLTPDAPVEMPAVDFLGCNGNYYKIVGDLADFWEIEVLPFDQVPHFSITWRSHPWLVTKFTALRYQVPQYYNASFGAPGSPADDLYHYNAAPQKAYLPKSDLIMLPTPGETLIREAVKLRSGPGVGHQDIGRLYAGETIHATALQLEGANIWLECERGHFIARFLYEPGYGERFMYEPTSYIVPEPPVLEPLVYEYGPTCQMIINAFERTWPRKGDTKPYGDFTYWVKLRTAVGLPRALEMVFNRGAQYFPRGPYFGQYNLSTADKNKLYPEVIKDE